MKRRRTLIWVGVAAGVVLAVLLVVVVLTANGGARPPAAAQSPLKPIASTATPKTRLPPTHEVAALTSQLESGDPDEIADALGLDQPQLTPQIVEGFGSSHLDFDIKNSTPYSNNAWDIPVTITTSDGTTSHWTASVIESNGTLVLLDTKESQ